MTGSTRPHPADAERALWYSTLVSEVSFLNKAQIVLGKIKTPYNKQRLIEQLESRLRSKEWQNTIMSNLEEEDIVILSAICLAPHSNMVVLHRILSPYCSINIIVKHIRQLEDAFVIYRANGGEYRITPPLQEAITAVTDVSNILLMEALPSKNKSIRWQDFKAWKEDVRALGRMETPVTGMEIAAVLSFALARKKVLKVDCSLSVAAAKDAARQFSCGAKRVEILLGAMINLSLIDFYDALEFNWKALKDFAAMPPHHQAALLCAATTTYNLEIIHNLAQLILDCDATTQTPEGSNRIACDSLETLAILFSRQSQDERDNSEGGLSESRYERLLSQAGEERDEDEYDDGDEYDDEPPDRGMEDKLIEAVSAAAELGFAWISDERICRLCFSDIEKSNFPHNRNAADGGKPQSAAPLLSVDASFAVTVMPGMSFAQMLPLVPFLELVSCQTASEFVITRESACRAFDAGLAVEDITKALQKCTMQKVSDSLMVSLESWYEAYKAATLYHGYVLQLSETAARRFELSPAYNKCVYQKLSDGVYLLKVNTIAQIAGNNEAARLLNKCGFKYMGTVRTAAGEGKAWFKRKKYKLRPLRDGRNLLGTAP